MIIDLSKYNKVTNWCNVKDQAEAVIIRVGYRGYGNGKIVEDTLFKSHLKGCISHEIPIGLYFMSQAITENEAIEEAEYCVNYAKQYGAPLGIYIDSEDADGTPAVKRADALNKADRTKMAVAFCDTVRSYGFEAGVYASESWFNSKLDYNTVKKYNIWVANYGKNTGAVCSTVLLPKYEMHQYTSKASVIGITGNVDLSYTHEISNNPYPVPTRTLKLCDLLIHGDDVKWLQTELANKGYLPFDEIDGWYGSITEAAVLAYQADNKNKLVVDGIAGKNTINLLRG